MLLFFRNIICDVITAHQLGSSDKTAGYISFLLYLLVSVLAGLFFPAFWGMNFKVDTANTILTATGILIPTTVAVLAILQSQVGRYNVKSEYEIRHNNKELSGLLKISQESETLELKRKTFRRLFVFISYAAFLCICIFAMDFIVLVIFGGFENHFFLGQVLFGLVVYCGLYCLESLKVLYYMLDIEMKHTE